MFVTMTCYARVCALRFRTNMLALLMTSLLGVAAFSDLGLGPLHAAGQVHFDVNASAGVRALHTPMAFAHSADTRLVSLELDVSILFQPGAEQTVREVMVQAACRRDDVTVVDYSPRTELQTDIDGPMQVFQEKDQSRDANLQGMGGYPGIGSISGAWNQSEYQTQSVQFLQRPARELAVAAGTTNRKRGVYFKIRPSSQTTLEGSRKLSILLAVPENWRADLMDVSIQAAGLESPHFRKDSVIARQSFVVALYQENDSVAALAAADYVRQQANLVRCVKLFSKTIEQRTFPTPFHKIGAKLDLYEPQIPDNWLDAIVYKPGTFHHTRLSALPVDVRVAIMSFQDQKSRMESLAGISANSAAAGQTAQTYTLGYRGTVQSAAR